MRPRLASVDPHHDQVGELAVSLLLARIRGERVAGQHLSRSTLVTRESCGCLDARAGALLEGLPAQEGSTAWRRLGEVARATFDGAEARLGPGADLDSWLRGVQRVFRSAAALGQPPTQATLTSLAESTRALRPHPEALEQLIPALRSVEEEFREQVRRGQVPAVPGEPGGVGLGSGCGERRPGSVGRRGRTGGGGVGDRTAAKAPAPQPGRPRPRGHPDRHRRARRLQRRVHPDPAGPVRPARAHDHRPVRARPRPAARRRPGDPRAHLAPARAPRPGHARPVDRRRGRAGTRRRRRRPAR